MPTFRHESDFRHDQPTRTGVLVCNLGSPDAPTPHALKRYLGQFLSDPRVVEAPRLIWWLVLNGIILNTRPAKSAKLYEKIWTEQGSPLIATTRSLVGKLRQQLNETWGEIEVVTAMRYGNPSIESGLEKLRQANVRRILILPLYPQYSATTTATTFDEATRILRSWRWVPELRTVNHYHDQPAHIDALCNSIEQNWKEKGRSQKLLFSFHGLPQRYLDQGDTYFCHCHKTARLVAEQLGLNEDEWHVAFQSRFGKEEWLKPYTSETLTHWGSEGIESVSVVCPAFAVDCLETLEEISQENRQLFLNAGGKDFHYIPALNDSDPQVEALRQLIEQHLQGWPTSAEGGGSVVKERAHNHGATN